MLTRLKLKLESMAEVSGVTLDENDHDDFKSLLLSESFVHLLIFDLLVHPSRSIGKATDNNPQFNNQL